MILLLEFGSEEVHGPSLSKNQYLLRITLERHSLDLLLLETESMHLLIDKASSDL